MEVVISDETANLICNALGMPVHESHAAVIEEDGVIAVAVNTDSECATITFTDAAIHLTRQADGMREVTIIPGDPQQGPAVTRTYGEEGEPWDLRERTEEEMIPVRGIAAKVYAAVRDFLPHTFH